MQLELVTITKDEDMNVIIGQTHFIKSVEDIYEAVVNAVPGVKFGLAFNEASGVCLVRCAGTDEYLTTLARDNALAIGAGHIFILLLGNAYPINVLNALKTVPEVCTISAAIKPAQGGRRGRRDRPWHHGRHRRRETEGHRKRRRRDRQKDHAATVRLQVLRQSTAPVTIGQSPRRRPASYSSTCRDYCGVDATRR